MEHQQQPNYYYDLSAWRAHCQHISKTRHEPIALDALQIVTPEFCTELANFTERWGEKTSYNYEETQIPIDRARELLSKAESANENSERVHYLKNAKEWLEVAHPLQGDVTHSEMDGLRKQVTQALGGIHGN